MLLHSNKIYNLFVVISMIGYDIDNFKTDIKGFGMDQDFYTQLAKRMRQPAVNNQLTVEDQKLFNTLYLNLNHNESILLRQVIKHKKFNLLIQSLPNGSIVLHQLLLCNNADFLLSYYDKVYVVACQNRQKKIFADASSIHLCKVVRSLDAKGRSPLLIACMQANETAALRLIKYDLDRESINISDNNAYSPLHIAYLFGMESVVAALIQAGAATTEMDNAGRTPEECLWLDFATTHQAIREVLSWLDISKNLDARTAVLYSNNMDLRISVLEAANKVNRYTHFEQISDDDEDLQEDLFNACTIC